MFDSVLMVCAGNICRSPTAEYVLKSKLAGKNIQVSSAGLTALEGKSADAMAQELTKAQGIDMSPHQGRQLNSALVAQNSLLLVMEHRHLDDLCSRYPQARGKTFLLGKWIGDKEIPDPYRQSKEAFEHVYQLIDSACGAWQQYL
ncbi:low molecular weight phosphotyrosine protein phosphatase [Pseudoalteromonas sp. McH1-7]|uniref:protein-tyrosine-phosphatase n=1 Tax=Pseudoalteromonas peptidolytica F12-50-A1 TaxID=1315280 RepID=A0A8I0MXY6_9GAMM|nr:MULTISPECIES: low molecular weight protein-tyrosine-phosphatase [Pseudoalteromonas]MBE0347306.1 protein-tyrosine phosphatase [Pseudoalteromonas peptidolytica F12-50-A1]MDW7549430.1 low molecular weight protein-tyrosine-phosphatase [Pseudoalteromonas peptidolytica]NLR13939.1 low molecular weight phosphotyrosine protein phosphatase [Pseudoalteromonas peptidolytica]NUZ10669.1 low molecular weight phosphotyrosine protein phosphatase [Pseudoalteromonas sp. McH1-7]RRS06924.1 low molecular weight 